MASTLDQNIQPTVAIHGNLRRTRTGAIWAGYQLIPLAYGYMSEDRKYDALTHHKNLFRALPNESLLAGSIAAMDPQDILSRMIGRTDRAAHPKWNEECNGKLDYYESKVRATQRIITLEIPIVDPDNPDVPDAPDVSRSARRSLDRAQAELDAAADMAAALVARLPSVFLLMPLTPAQMVWRWNRAIGRGSAPDMFPSSVLSNVSSRAGAFRQAIFDEGQRNANVKRWKPSSFAPLMRIEQPGNIGANESYQSLMAIESLPLEGLQFPGSEFFNLADKVAGFDIDWAVRIHKTPREQAISRNAKNLRRLSEQMSERDTEVSFAQNTLNEQVSLLAEYNGHLESNDDEMEIALCPMFAVAGSTRRECEDGALQLNRVFERNRIKLVAPLGGQRELWAAMNPGGTNHRAVTDFSHVTISEFAAASVPCTTAAVGDIQGPIIAELLTSSENRRHQPVHLDLMNEANNDSSPSVAMAGELGAGKSYTIKTILSPVVDLGGQFMAVDRTDAGEYERFANSLPNSKVVDLVRPTHTFDPLRIFPRDIGIEKTLDMLLPLFGCSSDSPMAMTLAELLHPNNNITSLSALKDYLENHKDIAAVGPGAQDLRQKLTFWASRSYSAALFNKNLDPLPLDADAIVVRTNRLEVPTTEEVRAGDLNPTKKFGRAMYGLSAAIARQAFFSNLQRFGTFVLDEAYHVTSTEEGLAIASMFIRDGRRHNSGLILGSHDPTCDFPDGTALNLIPIRMVFRHRDETLARRSLKWLGIDPDKNPHIVRDLRERTSPKGPDGLVPLDRRGEGYLRDARGAIGRIQVLGPSNLARLEAINTTPQAA